MWIGVVGASARAAVHSLARAGFSSSAIDLFADRDLKRIAPCTVCPLDRYPDAIPELVASFPPGPILYTGGLENHPHVIRELATQRELLGNPPEVLARVRDPFTLFPALASAGFATPRLVPHGNSCPLGGRWLRKPIRSGGGLGIRFAQSGEAASPHHYFQEFIDGVPMSVQLIIGSAIGVTQQLIGEPWLHARPFAYCGNVGPIQPTSQVDAMLVNGCLQFNLAAKLCGAGGMDFMVADGTVYPIEVNPRYTAGLEVLEHARHDSYLLAHLESFTRKGAFVKMPSVQRARAVIGKAIYYAPRTITFPSHGPWDADLTGEFDPWRVPQFADIPEPGSTIEAGSPVLTIFATGSTPIEVRGRLQSRAAELDQLFQDSP